MKSLKYTGMVIFLIGLAIFSATPFLGKLKLTNEIIVAQLSETERANLEIPLQNELVGQEFSTSFAFSRKFIGIYTRINDQFKAEQKWDQVMYTPASDLASKLATASNTGVVPQNKGLFLFLTFGICIIGS
jgi:ferredoxin-type protein NapH